MKSVSREAMKKQLSLHREEILKDIAALIAIPSVNGNKEKTDEALDFVLSRAKEMGMRTGTTKGHDAGYAEIGEGTETVGMLAHVDVVDIGDPERWPYPPFEAAMPGDGFIHGRGTVDDKGPVILTLYVMKAIMELGVPLKKKLRLIVGTSEESEWVDMANYFAEFGEPDYGFSPDGDFPIYNIEKGYCDVLLTFREAGRLDEIIEARSGESPNSIPSKALFKLQSGEEQSFSGVAFHSSEPQNGDNALSKLAAVAAERGFLFGKFVCDMFTDEHAPGLALDDGTDTYNGIFVDRTIASPTVLRKTEDGITLNVNIRARYGVTKEGVSESFARHAQKYGYTFEFVDFTTPMLVDPNAEFMKQMNEVYESYGFEGAFLVAGGASYAATMANCTSWGPIFPDGLSCAHMEDERISIDSLMLAGNIYMEYLITTAE